MDFVGRREGLEREAGFFYRSIFGLDPGPLLLKRYVEAHNQFRFNEKGATIIQKVVQYKLDVVSIEYIMRLRDKDNALTQRFKVLHFLAECQKESSADFIESQADPFRIWLAIVWQAVRTVRCLLLGSYLLRRYDLA